MPASKTITSYPIFTANTRARASEVNTNFLNHRGHNIPINTNTATASDLTHDLGSDEHRWNEAFVGGVDFETSTTTASLVLQGDTTATQGAFDFVINSTVVASIDHEGFKGTDIKPSSIPVSALGFGVDVRIDTFHASGTWTCPSGVTRVVIMGCGGGGGGGNADGGQGAGGAGAELGIAVWSVTPGVGYSVTIGALGSRQFSGGGAAGAGGTSSFDGISFVGGGGADQTTAGVKSTPGGTTGGNTGTAGERNVRFAGGTGPQGGGGGAGPYGAGGNGGTGASGVSAAANTGAGGGGSGNVGSGQGGDGGSGRVDVIYVRNQ